MASRRLVVEIVGDSRQLDRTFQRSGREAKKFERTMTTALGGRGGVMAAGRGTAWGAAALAATAGFVKTTNQASALNEAINRTNVVFGKSADSIQEWSRTTADAFGIAQVEALKAAGNFGQMFSTIGLGAGEAADMSRRLVELGADLASFTDEDPTEMLDRLRSGLAGEAEPLRRFGVLLSEVRVKQEAYRTGLARVGAVLTEQQKVQARYQLILKDTSLAQGDFARTSDSLANQQRILKAQTQELSTQLGKRLLPAMILVVSKANDGIAAFEGFGEAMEESGRRASGLAGFVSNLANSIGNFTSQFAQMGRSIRQGVPSGGPTPSEGPFNVGARGAPGALQRLLEQQAADADKGRRGTVEQRNAWWDAMLGRRINRVQDISSLQGQIGELRKIGRLIQQRMAATKDITRRLRLEDELLNVQRQIRGNQALIAARSKALAEERKMAAKERREREKQAREERAERARAKRVRDAFAMLGLTAEGEKPTPRMANLRRQLESLSRRVAGTAVGTRNRVMLNAIRKALALDSLPEEVRAKIHDIFQTIREEMGEGANSLQRVSYKWRKQSIEALIRSMGLDLTPAQFARLRSGLASGGPGLARAPGRSTAFAAAGLGGTPVVVHGDLVIHGVQDIREFENQIAKRTRSRPQVRRGAR